MGLELVTKSSQVACSTNRASKVPLRVRFIASPDPPAVHRGADPGDYITQAPLHSAGSSQWEAPMEDWQAGGEREVGVFPPPPFLPHSDRNRGCVLLFIYFLTYLFSNILFLRE